MVRRSLASSVRLMLFDAEDDDPDVFHGVYLGAAGVLWALHRLAQAGLHEPRHDYARLAEGVLDSYLGRPGRPGGGSVRRDDLPARGLRGAPGRAQDVVRILKAGPNRIP